MTVGADAHSGSILAVGNALLRDRATVHGSLTLGGQRLNQSVWTVEGEQQTGVPLATEPLNLVFQQPTTAQPFVRLEPGQARPTPLPPGRYQGLDLKSRATLTLTAGQYFFGSVNIEPDANLRIQDTNGRVFLVVSNSLVVKPAFQRVGGGFPNLQVAYSGTSQATLTAPFAGWVIAPRALINLEVMGTKVHEGAFFGKSVRLAPGVTLRHRPMPWLVQTVSVTPAQVCPGQSFEVAAQTGNVGLPNDSVKVLIDRVPVTRYVDQLFGNPGPREITVVAKASGGLIDSQVATVELVACPNSGPFPQLVFEENILEQDSIHVSVLNAADFEDGTQRYTFDFGDGDVVESSFPSVTHDYTDSFGADEEYRAFLIKVTVQRTGLADVQASRTALVWNTYAVTKKRGSIEPPTRATTDSLRKSEGNWVGSARIGNREPETLSVDSMRIDQVPCDGDMPVIPGSVTSLARTVQPGGSTLVSFTVPMSAIGSGVCGVQTHFFGSVASGPLANSSAYFEVPRTGSTTPVDPTQQALLDYLVENQLVANPDRISGREIAELYRQRRIRYSIAQQAFYQSAPGPTGPECDPQDLSDIPGVGYSCLPTSEFTTDAASYIANAYKGDAVLIHACGFVTDMFQKLDPPQKYSHSGMMIRNQDQLRHSTGQDSWLMTHGIGLGGLPTEGIEEEALRYFWPGPITASIPEAFEVGVNAASPEGKDYSVFGFNRNSARCPGDASIVFPRLVKPAPQHEASTRPRLIAAAEEAKEIDGHYRFSVYSDATIIGSDDPNAPAWGPQPTVCSAFVRQSLVNAGITVDADKALPLPSSVTATTPDGMYHYTEAERLAAAEALAAWLRNMARTPITEINDEYWWATSLGLGGGGALIGLAIGGPVGALLGAAAGAFVSLFVGPGDVVQAGTDTPNKIANQFANCFASDFCAIEANSSTAWREPGTGVALSPDDLMNHFDAPEQGGVYGYHEPLVYRTARFRRIYRWEPPAGPAPRTLSGRVEANGTPTEDARIEIPSHAVTVQSDSSGHFSFDNVPFGPVVVHASKTVNSVFYEVDRCYEPRDPDLWQEKGVQRG